MNGRYFFIYNTILLVSITTTLGFNGYNYCKISPEHTMCKYRTKDFGPACDSFNILHTVLTSAHKREILRVHNELRAEVARGEETAGKPGPQPSASNMLEVVWDLELEKIAKRFLFQCSDYVNDRNRDVERFQVSQSHVYDMDCPEEQDFGNDIVKFWYAGVMLLPNTSIGRYRPVYRSYGRGAEQLSSYTRMIWAKTRFIGCARMDFKVPPCPRYRRKFLCNYGPAGNIEGASIYEVGPVASKCPTEYSKPSKTYNGLCSNGEEASVTLSGSQLFKKQDLVPAIIILQFALQLQKVIYCQSF